MPRDNTSTKLPPRDVPGQLQPALARILIAPVIGWLIVFVIAPTLILLIYSFCVADEYGRITYSFTFDNYRQILHPLYLKIAARSVAYAGLTTLLCVVMAYPVAFHIGRSPVRQRDWLLLAIMIPFWTSFVIRAYAWITILSDDGLMSRRLQALHLISQPLDLLYTPGAVVLGLVYTYLPFMILPIYAAVEKLDGSLIEASLDLGAGPLRTFWRVVLPLTWSGVAGGIVLVFVPAVGMFAVSDLLGGGRVPMIGNVIQNQFGAARNQPFGAALGISLLVLFALAMLLSRRRPSGAVGP